MPSGILIALAASVANGFLAIIYQISGNRKYNVFEFVLYMQGFGFLFGLIASVARHSPLYNLTLIWLGLLASCTFIIAVSAYLMASRESDVGASWTILNLSLAIPIAFSLIYFHDHMNSTRGIGFAGVVLSVLAVGGATGKGSRTGSLSSRWAGWIVLAFVMNGCTLTIFRFVPAGSAPVFTLYFYGLSCLIVALRKLFIHDAPPKGLPILCLAGAASQWLGVSLTIIALGMMDKISGRAGLIVYPITNGLVIPIGVLFGALLLGERLSVRRWIGVALGAVSLFCLAV